MANNFIDLSGLKFGKLTVVSRASNSAQGSVRWNCRCCCGNNSIVRAAKLRNGHTKSCGCLVGQSRLLPEGVAAFNRLYSGMRRGAISRGFEFRLTENQVMKITKSDCYYCGIEPQQISKGNGMNGIYIYNGIDRIDNNIGYLISNVVPCCKECNFAKSGRSVEDFMSWAIRIGLNLSKKEI